MKAPAVFIAAIFGSIAVGCSSSDEVDPSICGANGQCPAGFECNPLDNRCYKIGGTISVNAAVVSQPDAFMAPDAPDVVNAPDAEAPVVFDAPPSPGEPDAPPPMADAPPPMADAPPPMADAPPPVADAAAAPDGSPPTFSILAPADERPSGSSSGSGPVTLSTLAPGVTVTSCIIDQGRGALEKSCCPGGDCATAGLLFSSLSDAENPHTIDVTVSDTGGLTDSQRRTWNVDTSAPSVELGAVNATAGDGSVRFEATLADASDVTSIFARLDRRAWVQVGSGTSLSRTRGELAAGEHVYEVYGVDEWGNSGLMAAAEVFVTEAYPPNTGRLVVLGYDFSAVPGADLINLIGNAANLVPFRQIPRDFTRSIQVLGWNGGTVNAAEKTHVLDAISVGLAARGVTWTASSDYDELRDPGDDDLREALFGHDVLLVFDQNGATGLSDLGTTWHDRLAGFLDAGGVVIVLDGRMLDDTTPSGTVLLVAAPPPAGGAPLLVATPMAAVFAAATLFPLFSDHPLREDIGDTVKSQPNTVGFSLVGETGQPFPLFVGPAQLCPGIPCPIPIPVVDKIFPVYTVAASVSEAPSGAHCPEGTIDLEVTPPPDGATYLCKLDDAAPVACAPGTSLPYDSPNRADNSHVFQVRTTDVHGNPGRAIAKGFDVDLTAPVPVAATKGDCTSLNRTCPTGYICDGTGFGCGNGVEWVCCQETDKEQTDDIYFHVSNDEPPGATFRCSLDGGTAVACRDANGDLCAYPFKSCSHRYTGLACGSHDLRIIARDECVQSGGATRSVTFNFQTCAVD